MGCSSRRETAGSSWALKSPRAAKVLDREEPAPTADTCASQSGRLAVDPARAQNCECSRGQQRAHCRDRHQELERVLGPKCDAEASRGQR
eukprot:2635704-Pyramimonas_sp.AAC.1